MIGGWNVSLLALAQEAGSGRIELLIAVFFILVLASLYGFEIITKVPATLHTPLMSGSNAISGITIVGALICMLHMEPDSPAVAVLGFLAIVFAMINVVGGFVVTDRMLQMFKRK